jgi:hypothetical protein
MGEKSLPLLIYPGLCTYAESLLFTPYTLYLRPNKWFFSISMTLFWAFIFSDFSIIFVSGSVRCGEKNDEKNSQILSLATDPALLEFSPRVCRRIARNSLYQKSQYA